MKLRRLELRGMSSAFRATTATIDFDALPPGIICLVGENGAGKTTILEAVPAALYRVFPSYDESLAAHVSPGVRDAMIRLTFDIHGRSVVTTVQADPQFGGGRGKVEAFVSDGEVGASAGPGAIAGPNLRDVDAALVSRIPPLGLFLASVFACQGGGGSFFELGKKERKELFAAMLGLERMQVLAEWAHGRWLAADRQVGELERQSEGVEERCVRARSLDDAIARQRDTAAKLEGDVVAARAARDADRDELERARQQLAVVERAAAEQSADAVLEAERAVRAAELRERAAASDVTELRARCDALAAAIVSAEEQHVEATAAAIASQGIEKFRELVALGRHFREAAEAPLEELDDRIGALREEKAAADLNHDRHVMIGSKRRLLLEDLAAAQVPAAAVCAECPLQGRPRELYEKIGALDAEQDALPRDNAAELATTLAELELELREKRDGLHAANVQGMRNDAELERLEALAVEGERRAALAEKFLALEDEHAATAGRLSTAIEHEQAAALSLEAAREELARAEAARAAGGAAEWIHAAQVRVQVRRGNLSDMELALQRLVDEHVIAGRTLEGLEGERRALGDPATEQKELRGRLEALRFDASAWAVLERALGRDGVQALEVDAAGPGVTAIANELLHTCYGPRFSIAIETTAEKKDGSGTKEVFDVRIIDSEAGREARRGSGGEMVLIDEALRLALAIWNTRCSGYDLRTLFRDETVGALSPANADRYVAMLERARSIGGFHHVLMIAQQPEVWQQAAARLVIANGVVEVDCG